MIGREAWERARRILCVRLDNLGDVLMTTPALRALKESAEDRRITLLASPAGAAVARLVPEIDDILVYEAPWMKATAPRADGDADLAMVETLRRGRFDAAAIFTVYSQSPLPSALLCHLAGIPLRLAHCRENPYGLLTDWVPEPEPERLTRHEVRRQLDLVAGVGATSRNERLSLRVPDEAHERVAGLLQRLELGRRWVAIHPGASAPSRRYPPEHFAAAAGALVREHGVRVVFTGSTSERDLIDAIRRAMRAPSESLAGALDLGELAALIEWAPALIVNNTGPAHIAAALGTPVVVLYALTNLQHTPWRVAGAVLSHDVPCKPCYKSVCPLGHHDCLRLVPPGEVVAAALGLIDGKDSTEPFDIPIDTWQTDPHPGRLPGGEGIISLPLPPGEGRGEGLPIRG
ncbi:MAG TPA: lipopolysaccharide heptosyltransferase II [Isosphaeraceae bacterium]|nr:lipopolysaccharide heptosyltransferase II [Isosphaeraceae bacterium]